VRRVQTSRVTNPQGMDANVIWAAYGGGWNHRELYGLGITGQSVNIKAIQATIGRNTALKMSGQVGYFAARPTDGAWMLLRQTVLAGVDYAVFIPNPRDPETSIYLLSSIFPLEKEDQMVRYLDLYTIWAVRPEWKEALFEAGEKRKLIKKLNSSGIEWAYTIYTSGWDKILDELAKDGKLTFEEEK